MKNITEDLKNKIRKSRSGISRMRWNDIYDSEEELIKDLFSSKVLTNEDTPLSYKWCKGYEYIEGFRRYFLRNKALTEKQMFQLKRMAVEIAYRVYVE